MVGRRGENFGVEKRWEKKIMRARRMGFSFIRKTASTGSSAIVALVAATGSLQPLGLGFRQFDSRKIFQNIENLGNPMRCTIYEQYV